VPAQPGFRSAPVGLVRAAAHRLPELPTWPDMKSTLPKHVHARVDWLRALWSTADVAEAVEHASPALAQQVRALLAAEAPCPREARRAVQSVGRYLLRMEGRATPFGFFAGVHPVAFTQQPDQRWGEQHRAVARAGAEWLSSVISQLEGCPELLARLPVVANNAVMVRGDRLVVPYQPEDRTRGTGAVEVSLRFTAAVQAALAAARAPIRFEDVAAKLRADFSNATPGKIVAALAELVAQGALVTSLHAPSTQPDALGHLVRELTAVGADTIEAVAGLVDTLGQIHTSIEAHNRRAPSSQRSSRTDVTGQMRRAATTRKHPLAVDLRLDAEASLPVQVAREVERATEVLTRLSAYPVGTPAWRAYHQRFYERYGIGSMVPLLDVVSDSGIGWPDGYPGTVTPERRSPASPRDEALLALAQEAALEGHSEVVLDEERLAALELGKEPLRRPSHLELGVRVHAASREALAGGDFRVEVVTVSRAAGVLTGRFLTVLEGEARASLQASLANPAGADSDTLPAQLSFPPLDPTTAHVTRAAPALPTVISIAEHRAPDQEVLGVEDLAVGCDGRRMYLAAPGKGVRLEAAGLHALNLRTHTPPLARFLTELSRAQCAQVTVFDWGLARGLPFLPRLRYGHIVVSPARWRLEAADLPAAEAPLKTWEEALFRWRARRRVPRMVHLSDGDRTLPLDLDHAGHRALLHSHLASAGHAALSEAPTDGDLGWCQGRPHEVIVPVNATAPPPWPPLPRPTRARVVGRGRGHTPAAAPTLLASLYGDLHRQDTLLTEHLPLLLDRLGHPAWWYVRYRDPDQHLRLRIALPDPAAFGEVAATVSTWAKDLHCAGLLREVEYPTSYPETGRWGDGLAWEAVEEVFRTDSAALLAQLGLRERPHRQALVAAHTVAIAEAFTGSTAAGMRWLIDHIPATAPTRIPRPVFTEAVRLSDPRDEWAALRAAPGGAAITRAWEPRQRALAAYRAHFPGPHTEGISVDDVLGSLMHVNFVRACGIDFDDEAAGLYLARAAAKAWTARTGGSRS
jgi:lantibiotic biosynthesis protein